MSFKKTACQIAAEFAPRGVQKIASGVCQNLVGASEKVNTQGDLDCTTRTNWLGQESTSCSEKSNSREMAATSGTAGSARTVRARVVIRSSNSSRSLSSRRNRRR